jgi:hypothetical protein
MAKTQVSLVDAPMGENSDDLERICYPWIDLYLAENFIWIGSWWLRKLKKREANQPLQDITGRKRLKERLLE